MNYYFINRAITLEKIANYFVKEYNLEPNFDIINLINTLGIEVNQAKLPLYREYVFGLENNKFIIYYNEFITKTTKNEEKTLEYKNRNLRFILAQALADILLFYQLENKNLIKEEYENKTYYRTIPNSLLYFNQKDKECDYLAACLLMPQERLINDFYEMVKQNNYILHDEDIKNLGISFGVNKKAVNQRCRVLNLIK